MIHVWKIDLITEQHHPFAKLHWSQNDSIRSPSVLAVMVKRFQQQLRRGCTREVQTDNLKRDGF